MYFDFLEQKLNKFDFKFPHLLNGALADEMSVNTDPFSFTETTDSSSNITSGLQLGVKDLRRNYQSSDQPKSQVGFGY